ncbi:MAG: type II toxin-antitoxin system RelE/ParE family toxin [Proteobacteria bacterium]|nr:type II toxin-antitoxin system RelE/ParE family toxin [Pseudomonadota bacterium]
MLNIRLTKQAISDMKDIGRYTKEHWGQEQRNRYLSKLDKCFQAIAREPHLGQSCEEIYPDYRKCHLGQHMIFYKASPTHIHIIRILHQRMDVEKHLSEN